jgi:lipopolysaccharide/colanic/teichoic acid biosynthesis glycosyltransferase
MEATLSLTLNKFTNEQQPESLLVIPFTPVKNNRLDSVFNQIIKRSVDIILGSFLMLLLFPFVLPVVTILIKLNSRGPVFFIQKRTGLRKKSFYCLKFRSMIINDMADRLEVQPNDSRITRVGYYLRKFHIDELPQIINVIIGDMSLVGPRPYMLRHTVVYSRLVKDFHDRHNVKPGLTGLAQMRGLHGIIDTRESLYHRCYSDIEYIKNWSLFGDVSIFFRTLVKIAGTL